MPVIIERCGYQVDERANTQKDEAKRRMEKSQYTNCRAIVHPGFLLAIAQRIEQHDKQGDQPGTGDTYIHHDMRWNPELIASYIVMPPPVPCQAEFCFQKQEEHHPGTHLADPAFGEIGPHRCWFMKKGYRCPTLCDCHSLPGFPFYRAAVQRILLRYSQIPVLNAPRTHYFFLLPLPRNRAVFAIAYSIVQEMAHLLNQELSINQTPDLLHNPTPDR